MKGAPLSRFDGRNLRSFESCRRTGTLRRASGSKSGASPAGAGTTLDRRRGPTWPDVDIRELGSTKVLKTMNLYRRLAELFGRQPRRIEFVRRRHADPDRPTVQEAALSVLLAEYSGACQLDLAPTATADETHASVSLGQEAEGTPRQAPVEPRSPARKS